MVKSVFIFRNGAVAVCDEHGEQITDLQGQWSTKAKEIYAQATEETLWYDSRADWD